MTVFNEKEGGAPKLRFLTHRLFGGEGVVGFDYQSFARTHEPCVPKIWLKFPVLQHRLN